MDVRGMLRRVRRKLGHVVATLRDRALVSGVDCRLVRSGGRLRWTHELSRMSRDELRGDVLAHVCDALEGAGVRYFVVPDPSGLRPQVGVRQEAYAAALTAVVEASRGGGWYAFTATSETLAERVDTSTREPVRFSRFVLVPGTSYVAGKELATALVPWEEQDEGLVPRRANAHFDLLRTEDLVAGAVRAHGRSWRSLEVLTAPPPDAMASPRWIVHVPRSLRASAPGVADALGRAAARSIWFHTAIGTPVTLLDVDDPAWLAESGELERRQAGEGDELVRLLEAWGTGERPCVVLPAGGLLVDDLPPRLVRTPGGLGLFRADVERLDERPPGLHSPRVAEAQALRAWFEDRVGACVPWTLPALPYGLPDLSSGTWDELTDLVHDRVRPQVATSEAAALVPMWLAYLRARAVEGMFRGVHHDAGSELFASSMRRLGTSRRGLQAVAVDGSQLVDPPDRLRAWERMARDRVPHAAPWERARHGE